MRAPAVALAALLLPAGASACTPALRGDGVHTAEGRHYVVAWRAPSPPPLAEFFAIELAACARGGGRVGAPRVDATMPAHGHGMNYRPVVEALGGGRFRASGLLLHMPGEWQLSISLGSGEAGETLRADLLVD